MTQADIELIKGCLSFTHGQGAITTLEYDQLLQKIHAEFEQ